MNRRKFLKNVAIAAGATFVLPRFSIAQAGGSANNKLNVAFIGIGGVGPMALDGMINENGVALCDVDLSQIARGLKKYPKARVFQDYREMLDKMGKEIDAVCISTPDHSHFNIAMHCMQLGKHVCVQKPLAHDIWQCRELEKARKYYKVKTQMMNQGHATEQIRMVKEWYDSGICGDVREVHVMCDGPNWKSPYFKKPAGGFPIKPEPVPADLNWEMWLNEAKFTDYNSIYTPLTWRSFWDYGTGMLGDWFCHTADAPVWSLDLKAPSSVELLEVDCSFDQRVFMPNSSTVKWVFPATDKRKEVVMYWYDGAKQPITRPHDFDEGRELPKSGMFMIGDKHTIETGRRPNFSPRMTNTKFFNEFKRNRPARTIPRARGNNLYYEWTDAIKGEIEEAGSNFTYATQLTEIALLGCLAQRFGGKIEWDDAGMRSPNRPELAPFIHEQPRKGWESPKIPA